MSNVVPTSSEALVREMQRETVEAVERREHARQHPQGWWLGR